MKDSCVIVIPARMGSTRFPEKPLALIDGKWMIERVWNIARASSLADEVVIATDNVRLQKAVSSFGARVLMTSSACATGTDRVIETLDIFPEKTIFFNLQGDAVLTPPWVIDDVLRHIMEDPSVQIATPAVELKGEALFSFLQMKQKGSSTGTSVVFDRAKNALYFSKTVLPHYREKSSEPSIYRHIGLYAYRREILKVWKNLPQGPLEKAEHLEQMRALENQIPIRVVEVNLKGRTHGSVDLPEDVPMIEAIIAREGALI